MPGYIFSDFGDSIRSFTNTGEEDDRNLSNVSMNIQLFKSFSEGFLHEMQAVLNEHEIENLAFSARYITFMQSIRFLTDYINGDTYYKTKYADHNLHRTRAQFALLESMEKQYDQMQNTIARLIKK